MEHYKSLDKYYKNKDKKNINSDNKSSNSISKWFYSFIVRSLSCCCLFLVVLILSKKSPSLLDDVKKYVYEDTFSFAVINKWYKEHFGDILPLEELIPNDVSVFGEKLVYSSVNLYKDGAVLSVDKGYLVPVLDDGIVIFVGEKEDYGHTVIVQQTDGVDVWYGGVVEDIKIYDYVKKGNLLGEALDGKLYLAFQKDGKFLDYKKYIS